MDNSDKFDIKAKVRYCCDYLKKISITLEHKHEISDLADIEDRTLTAPIRVLLKEALEKRKETG